jgi:hypothetical protein
METDIKIVLNLKQDINKEDLLRALTSICRKFAAEGSHYNIDYAGRSKRGRV